MDSAAATAAEAAPLPAGADDGLLLGAWAACAAARRGRRRERRWVRGPVRPRPGRGGRGLGRRPPAAAASSTRRRRRRPASRAPPRGGDRRLPLLLGEGVVQLLVPGGLGVEVGLAGGDVGGGLIGGRLRGVGLRSWPPRRRPGRPARWPGPVAASALAASAASRVCWVSAATRSSELTWSRKSSAESAVSSTLTLAQPGAAEAGVGERVDLVLEARGGGIRGDAPRRRPRPSPRRATGHLVAGGGGLRWRRRRRSPARRGPAR